MGIEIRILRQTNWPAAGLTVLLALGWLTPGAAMAQSEGPYLSGAIGAVWPTDSEFSGTGFSAEASHDPGLFGNLALGTTFGANWRAEAELSHRTNEVNAISGAVNGTGDVSGTAAMANGYYDLFSGSDWRSYVGAGVGVMRLDVEGLSPVGGSRIDDADWVVAFQGIAGIGVRLSDRFSLFTDYRYLVTTDAELRTAAGAEADGEFGEHRVLVGLRWSFGGPEPEAAAPTAKLMKPDPAPKKNLEMPWRPAAEEKAKPVPAKPKQKAKPKPAPPARKQVAAKPKPAKAPEAARRYLVHFEWDRHVLSAQARKIIHEAAQASTTVPTTVIRATGHTDRSGPEAYNIGLSKRRAEAVKAELMKLGVSVDEIFIQWRGEKEPAAQTADGVREAKNRRVEIVLQ